MKTLKIKKEFEDTCVGFNGSASILKGRKDLQILKDLAENSQNKSLLNLFEIEEVKEVKSSKK